MNKRGELDVGVLIMLFVGVIVAVTLLQSSAQNLNSAVNTVAVANQSIATVVNGTAQYITNYKSISDVVIINETGGVVIGAGNYTITNNVIYNGQEAIKIVPETTAAFKSAWKVSGTAQPLGYIAESGSRGVTNMIIVFAALAIAGAVLVPILKNKGAFG
jgi:hypothetical protein